MDSPFEVAGAFMSDFGQAEYALKRSNYLRKGGKAAKADWERFARSLGDNFFADIVAKGVAKNLIGKPPRLLLSDLSWSNPNPPKLSSTLELIVNGVCRVRNNYIHGEKFSGSPEGQWARDVTLIREAHAVLLEALNVFSGATIRPANPEK